MTDTADSGWRFNRDYHDLAQVEQFWPAYEAVYLELSTAGEYPFNDSFKGRIPGAEGPNEDSAIYLLQTMRYQRELADKLAARRADGWRDLADGEITAEPRRYAGVADYGYDISRSAWREWSDVRLRTTGGTVVDADGVRRGGLMVLPGRNRVNGYYLIGSVLVKDAEAGGNPR